ncbi:MerR family transcriptional regulator [Hymenobacter caeli]|uniref:DNA-binding transcriptional MerR regulator n=1 Tax=Hymenobacter caeli TaxID=2735894 RepID=A0ABX2FRT3_9BACT|nr:MerR family transcriptional regulator [Hymenobacter caeli]NRT19844.1 DNA-binding transcriptional MerR regulator [Hymenobacter caeli]
MGQYSISDLEQLSNVKAHTIRVWEQRYGLLQPARTAANIRYYSDDDLRRLLNVASLCERGLRISAVARLSEHERAQAVGALAGEAAAGHGPRINALVAAMLGLDEPLLHRLLGEAVAQLGLEPAMVEVVYPLLRRIGLSWQAGTLNAAQEHLVSQLVRQRLLVAADGLPAAPAGAPRWLLFLPEGELHELALLFINYALRARGQQVLFLGQNLPLADVEAACRAFRPDAVATVLTAVPARERVPAFAAELRRRCPGPQLVFYGPLAQLVGTPPAGSHLPALITDFLALIAVLGQLRAGQ